MLASFEIPLSFYHQTATSSELCRVYVRRVSVYVHLQDTQRVCFLTYQFLLANKRVTYG